jgi:predicted nuclease of predicted toxin-antitoxin system
LRFLVDAQLPAALARFIDSRGHNADMSPTWVQRQLQFLAFAQELRNRTRRSSRRTRISPYTSCCPADLPSCGFRIGNTRRAEVLRRFDAELPRIIEALEHGETLIEVT